ncbi:MAG: hypothetical protein M3198_02080 [Actinomycetota bacterium]|nr:hypothetical protein [Actinomycetota bacterium]
MTIQLDELRERTDELLAMRPAEVTAETTWLVGELEKIKEVLAALLDYLASKE